MDSSARPDLSQLSLLGKPSQFASSPNEARLETFENRSPQRAYWVRFDCSDFTSLCPVTGQPDFARLSIEYIPGRICVESKSLKYYLASFRNERAFNEEVVNRILTDFVKACSPRKAIVRGEFAARGGIALTVTATHPEVENPGGIS
jgi:7-cyano-7-deazaguanine reductase